MVSIIVPVYNEALYLAPCIESVISQTVSDWELILVDDGSTDGSAEICDDYAVRDARISVLHETNGGPARARNLGIKRAKGDYVAFIDGDDLLHAQYLESLLNVMQAQKADVVQSPYVLLSEADYAHYTPARLQQPLPTKTAKIKRFTPREAIESMLYQQEVNSSPFKLFSRQVLTENCFPEQFVAYEDLYAMLGIYACSSSICSVQLPIYYYFKRQGGTLNTWSLKGRKALAVMKSVELWVNDYDASLLPAVRSRELSMAFNILRILSKTGKQESYEALSADCWRIIRSNRKERLLDPKMRLKNKLGILFSFLLCK